MLARIIILSVTILVLSVPFYGYAEKVLSVDTLTEKGAVYYRNKEYHEAFKYLKEAADKGSARAQNYLGIMYDGGYGITQDVEQAIKYYNLAAESDVSPYNNLANFNLGLLYYDGKVLEKDYSKAYYYMKKAADMGHDEAQNILAGMFLRGRGTPKDVKYAIKYYKMAAEQDNRDAMSNLGNIYTSSKYKSINYVEGVKYYKMAADRGDAESQYNMAIAYHNGFGVDRDNNEAWRYMQLSADQGHEKAVQGLQTLLDKIIKEQDRKIEALNAAERLLEREQNQGK